MAPSLVGVQAESKPIRRWGIWLSQERGQSGSRSPDGVETLDAT